MLIVDVVTNLVTALVCGFIVTQATKERNTAAMRWIRAGALAVGLGALVEVCFLIATGSPFPFVASMTEGLLWSVLSTVGVCQFLRNRRRPSLSERLTTVCAAVSSSFGFIWLIGLGAITRRQDVGTLERSLTTLMLLGIVVQITVIVVALKRTEHASLPGFSTFAGASLTISFTDAMTAFDDLGFVSSPRSVTGFFSLLGVVGLAVSLKITNTKRPARTPRFSAAPLFYAPATIAVGLSVVKYADTVDEYVFGFTSMTLFAMLIGQTASHRSSARRTQAALERRVAQRTHELEQANQLVNRAVEFTADGIIALDPSQSVLFMNPASQRILGDTERVLDMVRARLLQGETCFDLLDEAASPPRTIRVIGTCLDFSSVSWVLTLRDVTEEIGLLRMKTRMLTAVSHEIRTPLTALHGSLSLLDSGSIDGLPPDASRLVRIARTSSDRLLRLVNEYLDFERLNAREGSHPPVHLHDLAGVVNEVENLMTPLAAGRMIRLSHDVESFDVPMARDQIVQVLTNLVHNAIKFSAPDCIITIEVHRSNNDVIVSVLDRGQGLREEELEGIFEPFFQSSLTEHSGGTGMGLAICRSIITKHGGRIWAERRDGGGAAFRFTLPVGEPSLIDRIAS